MIPASTVCVRCGEAIPPDEADCPYCAGRKSYPFLHREPVLIAAIIGIAVGLWLIAHGLTTAYSHRQDVLARSWYESGDTALRAGNYSAAIADLQTAVVYSHESPEVRLRLAEALAAAGTPNRTRQAQSYLRALWEEQPGDATVNLQLARLAARTGDVAEAERYYNGAIYGVWASDPMRNRRETRLELVRFLLARDRFQQAQSQLIAVAAEEPQDPELLLELGRMFLQAGDAGHALQEFRLAAKAQPRNPTAFAGAGQAAFQQSDFSNARRYFQRAVALDPADTHSADLLHISDLVLQLDPYAPRLTRDERDRRVVADIARTLERLQECATAKNIYLTAQPPVGPMAIDFQQLTALKAKTTVRALATDPDQIDPAMELVFRSQSDAAKVCGQPVNEDFAILLIGRANGAAQ
ncbi:MAG: tetratricopeptide repeat protein [Terriglobales bacterium]